MMPSPPSGRVLDAPARLASHLGLKTDSVASSIPHGGMEVSGFYLTNFMGAVFPLTAGLLLYGWRGAAVIAAVLGSTALAVTVWRRMGPRGRMLHYSHALWLALLLAMMLPASLAAGSSGGEAQWPILPLGGLLLVIILWLLGGLGGGHIHPVLVTYLLLVLCYSPMLVPHRILNRDHLFFGDLFRTSASSVREVHDEAWIARLHNASDADFQEPAAERLTRYTSGHERPARKWLSLSALLRDRMPPLEDLIIAGQPGPIGASSAVAVIIGWLFLLYRGMFDFRIPLFICVAAFVALLILPIPAVIGEEPQWRWVVLRLHDVSWPVAVTFVDYEIMASPLIFMACFLATSPTLRPMTRRGRTIYAVAIGLLSAAFQLYVSCSFGPYLALLIVSLLTPELDRWFKVRPVV